MVNNEDGEKMSHICTNKSINMGATKEDLQFKSWCPYCDKIVTWEYETIHDEAPFCTKCKWSPTYLDNFPKGLNANTGKLEL